MSEEQPMTRSNMEQAIARQKSYVGTSFVIFFLYFLFYIPGAIANLIYLNEARKNQKFTGVKPSGMGCLWTLLVFGIIIPGMFVLWLMVAMSAS